MNTRPTNPKRAAILKLIKDGWSDREIARRLGCDNHFVGELRPKHLPNRPIDRAAWSAVAGST